MIKANTQELKTFLETLGLEVHEQQAPSLPSQLTFAICEDAKERPIYISLVVHPVDMGSLQQILKINSQAKAYHRLQLFSPLPFQFKPEAAAELARFLMMINKSIEYPGFECNETDRVLYFKMAWPFEGDEIDPALLANQLYYVTSLMSSFSEGLEAVGQLKMSLKEYFEKFLNPAP
jgi:hypothetical protein